MLISSLSTTNSLTEIILSALYPMIYEENALNDFL